MEVILMNAKHQRDDEMCCVNNVFGPFYSRARCDTKARGPIIRAFAEHRAQQEKFGILAIFGPFRCIRIKALGTVWVFVGIVV